MQKPSTFLCAVDKLKIENREQDGRGSSRSVLH